MTDGITWMCDTGNHERCGDKGCDCVCHVDLGFTKKSLAQVKHCIVCGKELTEETLMHLKAAGGKLDLYMCKDDGEAMLREFPSMYSRP